MLESGAQTRLHNRVLWAHVYLAKAKLFDRIARSRYCITDRVQQLLASKPAEITPALITDNHLEFKEFATPTRPTEAGEFAAGVARDSMSALEQRLDLS